MRDWSIAMPVLPAFACILAVSAYASGLDARESSGAIVHTVVIEGMNYEPAMLTVRRGDTVVWVNKDSFPHSATADGVFDSGAIAAGRFWRYKARRKAGSIPYFCTFHPSMKAVLRVN